MHAFGLTLKENFLILYVHIVHRYAKRLKAMEAKIKEVLGVKLVKKNRTCSGGCISEGSAYETDKGLIFVKINSKDKAKIMFNGEVEGLKAILKTNTVRVPKPITVFKNDFGGAAFIMEYIKMSPLINYSEQLGELLSKLHLSNMSGDSSSSIHKVGNSQALQHIEEFGFHTVTCCGYIPQDNSWKKDWIEFYAQQRLQPQFQLIEKEYGDRQALELWSELQIKISSFFQEITITPALLHGDLWSGNVAEDESGPVVFDPATFYGHSEFDLAIAKMFGGFSSSFYQSYYHLLPKLHGYEKRQDLYQLFHYLNHWNHFGSSYRNSTISVMKKLLRK